MPNAYSPRPEAYYQKKVCYCCEQEYGAPHWFYSEMCESCGEFNYQKRTQTANLSGFRALVTGGRLKIGFETARLLLQMGADVTITSRFPNNAYQRYAALPGFETFSPRLHIIAADFRHLPSIQNLIAEISRKPLDILINNAAQTVRKPAPFYKHLLAGEQSPLAVANIIAAPKADSAQALAASAAGFLPALLRAGASPAEMSQALLLPEDCLDSETIFPRNQYDKDGQQLDLRPHNSWMYELEEIPLAELYEVMQINLIAPFLLNTKLLPALTASGGNAYIVNVSAMEGNFYAPRKHSRHPHTNMAKAALNMMTRTSAPHYREMGVYMNSVDTGWITNEKPNPENLSPASRKTRMAIDETDGAMRVLDPILAAVNAPHPAPASGKLFKNYREYPW